MHFFQRFWAFILLLGVLPVCVIIALGIWWDDGGRPFFVQQRLGKGRVPFRVYKFRTMRAGRVTRLGRYLRRVGLDELPQLWNIVRGDMHFIGPRPLTAEDVKRLGWTGAYYELRWSVRPGLTGLAQLAPICHAKVSWLYDKTYVQSASWALDFKILFWSAAVLCFGKSYVKKRIRR